MVSKGTHTVMLLHVFPESAFTGMVWGKVWAGWSWAKYALYIWHAYWVMAPVLLLWLKKAARPSKVFLAPPLWSLSLLHRVAFRLRAEVWKCPLLLLNMPASKHEKMRSITAFQICMKDRSFTADSQPCNIGGWENTDVAQLGEAQAACPQSMAEGCCCYGLCQELWGISSWHTPTRKAELLVSMSVPALCWTLLLLRLAPKQMVKPEVDGFEDHISWSWKPLVLNHLNSDSSCRTVSWDKTLSEKYHLGRKCWLKYSLLYGAPLISRRWSSLPQTGRSHLSRIGIFGSWHACFLERL